jgi:hypothetical protein
MVYRGTDEADQGPLGDLGSPVQPGSYRCGSHTVEVTPGDIKLANDNPDAVFTAIHPDFYTAEALSLLKSPPG